MALELQIKRRLRKWIRRAGERVYPPTYVLGRVACLGQEVHKLRLVLGARRTALLNMQKVRCDVILEWLNIRERSRRQTRAGRVREHLAREDIAWLLDQQERMIWFERRLPIASIVMDSFAELTDQRFRHRREGWTFACHYSDLKHTPEFQSEFECLGLLAVEKIGETYRRFFEWVRRAYPGVPVYFLHFPAALDERPVFQARAAAIVDAIEGLAREQPSIHSIRLADEEVSKAPGDDFAYHFSAETMQRFAARWEEVERGLEVPA